MGEFDHPDGLRYFFVYCGAEAISDMSFHLSGFRCTLPCFEETLQKKRAEVWKGGDSAALPDVSLHELKPVPDICISLVLDQSGPGLGAVGTV